MNLLFWSGGTRPHSRVCEGEALSLELFIFHVNEEKGHRLSSRAQNVIFCLCPAFLYFFSEQLQQSLISDVLLRMLTQEICTHLQ